MPFNLMLFPVNSSRPVQIKIPAIGVKQPIPGGGGGREELVAVGMHQLWPRRRQRLSSTLEYCRLFALLHACFGCSA
uniref:GPN-loop GTPase 3 n=1 Tax=Oryza barthii TaxID=65489 RepID=A0A0D3FN88_9ORYZ